MDNSNIRRSDLIQTYYSGKETPANKEIVIPVKPNRIFSNKLWISVVVLFALTAGTVIAIGYFHTIKERPIDITKSRGLTLSPVKYYNNIAYYNYKQIEHMEASIMLEPNNSCAAINFGKIMDLTAGVISFRTKGEHGTEKVAIILKDIHKMSNANRDDVILTPVLLNNEWQHFNIELKGLYLPLDKSRITQVRFDTSTNLTKNRPQAKVYIKDIVIK